jgi:hypothetical protein
MTNDVESGMTQIYEKGGRERGMVRYTVEIDGMRVAGTITHSDYLGRADTLRAVPSDFVRRAPEPGLVFKLNDDRWVEIEMANDAGRVTRGHVISTPSWAR